MTFSACFPQNYRKVCKYVTKWVFFLERSHQKLIETYKIRGNLRQIHRKCHLVFYRMCQMRREMRTSFLDVMVENVNGVFWVSDLSLITIVRQILEWYGKRIWWKEGEMIKYVGVNFADEIKLDERSIIMALNSYLDKIVSTTMLRPHQKLQIINMYIIPETSPFHPTN